MSNKPSLSDLNAPSMSSMEIAEFTGKQHSHVIRDIENMFKDLEVDGRAFLSAYQTAQNKQSKCYILDRHYYLVLITGYEPKYMAEIVDRMNELAPSEEASWENIRDIMKECCSKKTEGYFYIYQFKDFLKVGISKNDPHGRLKSHQNDLEKFGLDHTVVEQYVIKAVEYKQIERDVINHFAEYATIKGGEWFAGLTAYNVIKFIGE